MTKPERGSQVDFDLHAFLRYCHLVKRIRKQFESWDNDRFFDICLFFLRGSFGIWSFVNTETDLQLRSTMCGGLRHDPEFLDDFKAWLRSKLEKAEAESREKIDFLIIDEVKSGTGIGHQMNTIATVLREWVKSPIEIGIRYIAVAPPDWKRDKLPSVLRKWQKQKKYRRNKLRVQFKCLVGHLIAYDNDRLLGISQVSIDQSYQAIRHEGGLIAVSCPNANHNNANLMLCPSGEQNNIIGELVAAIVTNRNCTMTEILNMRIQTYGCPICRALWSHISKKGKILKC